ncbi:hypothetical protein BDZ94DRAFT_1264909 [Collybia nuda]|uniref:Uncharacterized protein n=1 Tax=Collybia nuda TaxID=64659 RepID=A0A9P6CCP2_9AGAR|nr:hypothetical protein BDZ94DRAFT_1264909 [Collybia nuda]
MRAGLPSHHPVSGSRATICPRFVPKLITIRPNDFQSFPSFVTLETMYKGCFFWCIMVIWINLRAMCSDLVLRILSILTSPTMIDMALVDC